jgi:hypothetical protein
VAPLPAPAPTRPLPPPQTKVTPPPSVPSPVEPKEPKEPKEPAKVAASDVEPPVEPPPRATPRPTPDKDPPPDKPRERRRREREKSKERDGETLQVTFRLRKPQQAKIECGGEASKTCDGTCTATLAAGAQCTVKSRGFSSKRFKFDDLDKKARRGKVKVDVSLSAS